MKLPEKIECNGCWKGVFMCRLRPCWGTVEDFKKIIDAGYSDRLMIDYYKDEEINNDERIYFLCGANNGNEGSKADWNPKGTCSFLEDEKCIIHDIKPTIGAIACCKRKINIKKNNHICLETWLTQEGTDLIEKWKVIVDYIDKDDDAGFDFMSPFNLMFGD